MTKSQTILIFLTLVVQSTFGQLYNAPTIQLKNETGEQIDVYVLNYHVDTTNSVNHIRFTDNKSSSSPARDNDIRVDVIALLGSDTIFSKSIKPPTGGGDKVVRIKRGQFSLEKPLTPIPQLRVTGSNKTGRVLKIGDHLVVQLRSKKKVRGFVNGYTKTSITVKTKKGELIEVKKEDLRAFRESTAVFMSGARFVLFPYFEYKEIKDIKFEFVQWVDTGERGPGTANWVEVK